MAHCLMEMKTINLQRAEFDGSLFLIVWLITLTSDAYWRSFCRALAVLAFLVLSHMVAHKCAHKMKHFSGNLIAYHQFFVVSWWLAFFPL